jgi:hypothetical protein
MVCAKNPKISQDFINERFPEIHTELTYDGVSDVLTVWLETDLEYELLISYLIAREYY